MKKKIAIAVSVWLASQLCSAESLETINLLSNGDFETPSHQVGSSSHYSGPSHIELNKPGTVLSDPIPYHGQTGADQWVYWLNNAGYLNTQLLPSTLIDGGSMMGVDILGAANGIVQVFSPIDTGPDEVTACVWIYVERGEVGVGVGNGGNTHISAKLSPTGRWEKVQIGNAVSPANEIIIYAVGAEGARFFVESASVTTGWPDENCCQPE